MIYIKSFIKRTWAEINLNALRHNIDEIRKSLDGNVRLMCIVKADAYGHGLKYLLPVFEENADFYGVSNIEEALDIRRYTEKPILILGYTPTDCAEKLAKNNITQTVFSLDYAKALANEAEKKNVSVCCHIKIDTGMNRIGFSYFDAVKNQKSVDDIIEVSHLKALKLTGIFTHFAQSDDIKEKNDFTQKQFNRFCQMINVLEKHGITFDYHHCCNSAGIFMHKDKHLDMVRAGITLYGLLPDISLDGKFNLMPVMTLKSTVAMIKNVPAGNTIGYGRTFKTEKPMKIATVPIGYADGYNRQLSNKGSVLIEGKLARITGRVCMDQIMVDITDFDDLEIGDEVILFGDKNNTLSADSLAQLCGTIGYEIVSNLGKRVPLVFIENGSPINIIDYYEN